MVLRGTGKNNVKMNSREKKTTIQVAGQEVRIVKQYKHLGSMCTPSGAMGPEVSWRVYRTRVAYVAVAGHFFGAATFSLRCKKSVAATFLETRLLYSSETWPPSPVGHAKRLEGVQMSWTRKAVKRHRGEGCRGTDAQIRAEFSIATVESKVRLRRLSFFVAAAYGLSLASRTAAGSGHATALDQGDCWRLGGPAGSRRYRRCRAQQVMLTRG